MKLSMYLNAHSSHQEGLCNAFYDIFGDNFKLVLFGKLPQYRIDAGFEDLSEKYPYCVVLPSDLDEREKALNDVISWSDIGIVGAAPSYIFDRFIAQNKKCFLFSERFYKKGTWRRFYPPTLKAVKRRYRNNSNFSVLCASAFLPYDLKLSGYKGECLQWGYFPQIAKKEYASRYNEKVKLLWIGRLIGLKHVETYIKLAKRLKNENLPCEFTLVGYGEEKEKTLQSIKDNGLEDIITFHDAVPPHEVHNIMREHDIFIATSDYHEGWGVVINESLTTGCVVVASSAMGAVSFLVEDGYNGFSCAWNDDEAYYQAVKKLIENEELRKEMSKNAYNSMVERFSPQVAADRFCRYMNGERFETGICSTAPIRKK